MRRDVVSSFSVLTREVASEDENEEAGGSCTRNNAIRHYVFPGSEKLEQ